MRKTKNVMIRKALFLIRELYTIKYGCVPSDCEENCKQLLKIIRCFFPTKNTHILLAMILVIYQNEFDFNEIGIEKIFGKKVAQLFHELTPGENNYQYKYYYPNLKSREAVIIFIVYKLQCLKTCKSAKLITRLIKQLNFWKTEKCEPNSPAICELK